jgi:hypothetical protein
MKPGDLVRISRYYHPRGPEFGIVVNELSPEFLNYDKFQVLWGDKVVLMFYYEMEYVNENR